MCFHLSLLSQSGPNNAKDHGSTAAAYTRRHAEVDLCHYCAFEDGWLNTGLISTTSSLTSGQSIPSAPPTITSPPAPFIQNREESPWEPAPSAPLTHLSSSSVTGAARMNGKRTLGFVEWIELRELGTNCHHRWSDSWHAMLSRRHNRAYFGLLETKKEHGLI